MDYTFQSTLKMSVDESPLRESAFYSYTLEYRRNNMSIANDSQPVRSYDRSWGEIEEMLDKAVSRRDQWKKWFEQCRKDGDRDGMKEAARNHKALDGVIKTLRWTLGEEGVDHPLD